jgi:magnesium chelatase family protein
MVSLSLAWLPKSGSSHDLPSEPQDDSCDFSNHAGEDQVRFAAEVMALGGHHLQLTGPDDAGNTMIAQRLPGILPALTRNKSLTVTAIHSIAGGLSRRSPIAVHAPFVAPHQDAGTGQISSIYSK